MSEGPSEDKAKKGREPTRRLRIAPDTRMSPGTTFGKYTILRTLGEGPWGAVYLAEDPILDRRVALKVLSKELSEQKSSQDRFHQSVRLAAKLNHPNIVGLHDAGEHEGCLYLVLELVEGRSLANTVKGGESLPILVFLRIMAAVAGALQHAHEKQVIHRDVKPANIIVSPAGKPTLADFEFAIPFTGDPFQGENVVSGTPLYMSPEQASGRALMPLSDIWSVGASMYQVICGLPLYGGETARDVMTQIISPEPVDLLSLEGEAPEFVIDIIGKCLKKDPKERYQTADELKRALEAAIDYIETSQSDTVEMALPRKGQTVLLHVEYQESGLPGAFRPYEIGERIGGGTFGDVYRAVEKLSGKAVALKILRREWVADADAVARFRREATLLSRLSHPNIVRVYNFGRYGASFFMAMDLLGERTLGDVMADCGPMSVKEALAYLDPTLAGLSAMHEAGIVHRDLKPDNIAVAEADGKERVVLFDFNTAFARDLKKLTMSRKFIGTLNYASPEQASALGATGATDIYAAGVILYEMLTGRLPHEAETTYALLQKIVSEPPVPVTERRADLPEAVPVALDRMLAKEPENRPSAAEARKLLAAVTG